MASRVNWTCCLEMRWLNRSRLNRRRLSVSALSECMLYSRCLSVRSLGVRRLHRWKLVAMTRGQMSLGMRTLHMGRVSRCLRAGGRRLYGSMLSTGMRSPKYVRVALNSLNRSLLSGRGQGMTGLKCHCRDGGWFNSSSQSRRELYGRRNSCLNIVFLSGFRCSAFPFSPSNLWAFSSLPSCFICTSSLNLFLATLRVPDASRSDKPLPMI